MSFVIYGVGESHTESVDPPVWTGAQKLRSRVSIWRVAIGFDWFVPVSGLIALLLLRLNTHDFE